MLAALTDQGRRAVSKAGAELAEAQFGLIGVGEPLARRLTLVLGKVRAKLDDA